MSNITPTEKHKRQKQSLSGVLNLPTRQPLPPATAAEPSQSIGNTQHHTRSSNTRPSSSHSVASGAGSSSSSSSSSHSARQVEEEADPYGEDDFDFMEGANDVPNDTMAAILTLQQQFYGEKKPSPGKRRGSGENGSTGRGRARTGLVLQHQIYTILQNRTAVDLELTTMRKDNTLRTFRLSTGREDWGVMSTEHYLKLVSKAFGDTRKTGDCVDPSEGETVDSRTSEDGDKLDETVHVSAGPKITSRVSSTRGAANSLKRPRAAADVTTTTAIKPEVLPPAGDVLKYLVRSNQRAYTSRKEVTIAMREVSSKRSRRSAESGGDGTGAGAGTAAGVGSGEGGEGSWGSREGGEDEEPDLSSIKREEAIVVSLVGELIRAGFLLPRRDVGREEAYWFSVPQLGKLVVAVTRGRKDIVNMLKRTRYKEIRRSALESKNPVKTGLPLSFHVRDLMGIGMVKELHTPSGAFLRLAADT